MMGRRHSSGPGGVLQGEGMTGGESGVQGREGHAEQEHCPAGQKAESQAGGLGCPGVPAPLQHLRSPSFKLGVLVPAEELGDTLIGFAVGSHKNLKPLTT